MKDQLQQRLQQLKTEYKSGQKALADLEDQQVRLRDTLLRISGAIQILEEMLSEDLEQSVVSDETNPDINTTNYAHAHE